MDKHRYLVQTVGLSEISISTKNSLMSAKKTFSSYSSEFYFSRPVRRRDNTADTVFFLERLRRR